MKSLYRILTSSLLGAAVFAFWFWLYPQDLSYQEQNQLFLFTWNYLGERLMLPGGPADWLSEFLVQFFYYRWAGALIMAEMDGCVFGASDPRQGCCGSVYTLPQDPAFYHRVRCAGGVMEQQCAALLQAFFSARRP